MRQRLRLSLLFQEFINSEQASGLLLLFAAGLAMLVANSPLAASFNTLFATHFGFHTPGLDLNHTLLSWINEGLMVFFFILIGLEIEREVYDGELSDLKNALLPLAAAIGGMLAPALIHYAFNRGLPTQLGFGIPMATDIAFALGVLRLLGNRVPASVKVFITAFAIMDDIGAMIVIALVYSQGLQWVSLLLALLMFGVMGFLNLRKVYNPWAYLLPGVAMWYFTLVSGVHTSIAGVAFAFAFPFADGKADSPSLKLELALNKPVAMFIMPLFAFANSGVAINAALLGQLLSPNSLGIFTGLVIGKPLGIISFSLAAVKLKIARLPDSFLPKHLLGVGFLGGIGFTISTFITVLAFNGSIDGATAKIAIMLGSLAAGFVGYTILNLRHMPTQHSKRKNPPQQFSEEWSAE